MSVERGRERGIEVEGCSDSKKIQDDPNQKVKPEEPDDVRNAERGRGERRGAERGRGCVCLCALASEEEDGFRCDIRGSGRVFGRVDERAQEHRICGRL